MPFRPPAAAVAAALTSAVALACGATAAHAAKITETTYDVTVEAKVTYGHSWHRDAGRGAFDEETTDAVATVKTTIDDVLFRDGKIVNPGQWGLGDTTVTGAGQRINRYRGSGDQLETHTYACTPEGHSTLGRTILGDNPDGLEPLGPGERLTVRVTEGLRVSMPCAGSSPLEIDLADFAPFGQGLLDADFDLPGEAIGQGTIIQLIHSTPAQEAAARCPGRNDSTTRCAYSWEGTVRFDRTDHRVFGDTPPAPPKAPSDSDLLAPLVPPKPPADDSDLLAPLVPVKSASLRGSTLRFKAACPSGCAGTLTVASASAKAAAAAARKPVTAKFTIQPGAKARTISVKLNAKLRAALRKAKKPAVKLTLKPKGGTPVTRTLAVKRAK